MALKDNQLWYDPFEQYQGTGGPERVMGAMTAAFCVGLAFGFFALVLFSEHFYGQNVPIETKTWFGFAITLVMGTITFFALLPLMRRRPIRAFLDQQPIDDQLRHQLYAIYQYEVWLVMRQWLFRGLSIMLLLIAVGKLFFQDLGGPIFEFFFLGSIAIWFPFSLRVEWQFFRRARDIKWQLDRRIYLAMASAAVLTILTIISLTLEFSPSWFSFQLPWQTSGIWSLLFMITTTLLGEYHARTFRQAAATLKYDQIKNNFSRWQKKAA